jgi:hypothetical protein
MCIIQLHSSCGISCRNFVTTIPKRVKPTFATVWLYVVLLLLMTPSVGWSQATLGTVPFSFTLSTAATTSAGVFKKDSTLVRTLWSSIRYEAGTYTEQWDGTDDDGRLLPNADYQVRVLSNNVAYEWEGVLGNTSTEKTGPTVHRQFQGIHGMVVVGSSAYYCTNYTEGMAPARKFSLSAPQQLVTIPELAIGQATRFVASDGTTVYWAGANSFFGLNGNYGSFVFGSKAVDDTEAFFPNGVSYQPSYGRLFQSALDVVNSADGLITGLTVQKKGPYLFVARKATGTLHVLDKKTGLLVRSISLTNPKEMCVDGADNLWLSYGDSTVEKFTVNADGTLTSQEVRAEGLVEPIALAVSPDDNTLLIADAGTSQQLKAYSNTTGSQLWNYGQAGGYQNNPTVTSDKFYFTDTLPVVANSYKTWLAFEPDGTFWVGDAGNYRALKFDSQRTLVNTLMYLPHNYSALAVQNAPTRVFGEYLEFEVDYSKPLEPDNGSWKFVRNWRASIPTRFYQDFMVDVFKSAVTFPNGRTYALLTDIATHQANVVELPPNGAVRPTDIVVQSGTRMEADGTLKRFSYTQIGQPATWYTKPLVGFDSDNNPQWGAETVLATLPVAKGGDALAWGGAAPGQVTVSNVLVSFDLDLDQYGHGFGYHLGGLVPGTTKWLWQTAKATPNGYQGPFPAGHMYDVANNVNYAGGNVYVNGRSIFWNYKGENWKSGQTNKWNHVWDDGLVIGQFGVTTAENGGGNIAGNAGNVSAGSIVEVNGNLYLYHNDESVHGGIHRWKITGLATVQEQTVPVALTSANGLLAQQFRSADLNNFTLASSATVPTLELASQGNAVRWTGFVQPKYSERYTFYMQANQKVRVWLNDTLVINQWANASVNEFAYITPILQADTRYQLRVEINEGSASLAWSSDSQPKQVIPTGSLYQTTVPAVTQGVDLMEGLLQQSILENNYGWTRNPVAEDSTAAFSQWWSASTGFRSAERASSKDLYIRFRYNNATNTVSRDLGTNTGLNSWKLTGLVNFAGLETYDYPKGGLYLDILDAAGKIIARFFPGGVPVSGGQTLYIYGNSKIISSGALENYVNEPNILYVQQPLEISALGSAISVKYGPYAAVTDSVFETGADARAPKSLRIHFFATNNSNFDRVINLDKMRFLTSITRASAGTPLALALTSLKAQVVARRATAIWNTTNEVNTDHFVVEKSVDGMQFSGIGKVNARNNVTQQYSLIDVEPLAKATYYRLKIVDFDGSVKYSPTVLAREEKALGLTVYPNPVQETLQLTYPLAQENYALKVLSLTGKNLLVGSLTAGTTAATYDVRSLPPGIYLLQIRLGAQQETRHFIKQ